MKLCNFTLPAALFVAAVSLSHAQTAAAPAAAAALAKYDANKNGVLDPDELERMNLETVLRLSPFEVRTDQDRGYQAANAGSGGRVDMPLKLTASATSAFTKEFLEDWNVTDMRESFRYAMNVDAGNLAQMGTPYGEFEFNFRGVGSSGNYPTRNYFLFYGVSDSYNTERFEMSRGPNSILFGDGQIGGVATTATKVPRLDGNFYVGTARVDDWGGLRTTVDINRKLGDMTALRVNGKYQKNTVASAWRDNAHNEDQAVTVALAHAFTPRTKFRTEVEFGRENRMTWANTYGDQMAYYTPGFIFDRTNPNLPANQGLAGITAMSTNAENWTFIPALAQFGLLNTGGSAANLRSYRSTGHGFPIQPDGRADLPGVRTAARLPSREFNLGANDTIGRFKNQVYSFYLDQRITDNLFGQISYYHYDNDRNERSNARAGSLQLDINRYLPNGQLNPKVGIAYGEATPGKSHQDNWVHEWRGLLRWNTRLPFRGKGQFSAIVGERNERFEARAFSPARLDGPNQNWLAAENTLRYRYYADEPSRYGSRFLPPPTPGFTYGYVQTGFASTEFKDIKYLQGVAATSFLDDQVSLVLGLRRDDQLNRQQGNIGGFPDAHGLQSYGGFVPGLGNRPGAWNIGKAKPITGNVGTVVWLDQKQRVGLFYNYSENFAPPTSGAAKITGWNADGTIISQAFGATTGNGTEYGVRLSLLDGALYGEIRHYDNQQVDRIDGPPTGNFNSLWQNAGNSYNTNPDYAGVSWRDVAALNTNGYEIQVTGNYKGWRVSANYALPKTENIAIRPVTQGYFAAFLPKWTDWANNLRNDKGDVLTTDNQTQIRNQIVNLQNNFAGVAPGTVNNGTNKWTGSLNANYSFPRESKLRGWSAGWAVSGRGRRKVGSVNPNILFNLPVGTTSTPDQNKQASFAYVYATTYWVQDMNASYTRRIGKHNWRFQVNINNVFDKDDYLFQSYTTYRELGQATNPFVGGMVNNGFNYFDPRKISFTTTVSF
ncbi:MAG: TonB-dependent receptor plug domain-containing protein [Verrucomicrobia bacterium]|nr:TonB-dependent receptor plug domain-containing protein [Verrucomicrobiota bacterium]